MQAIYRSGFTMVVIAVLVWRGRREIRQAWGYRHLFSTRCYWSIAALYILSGASITFSAFGATAVGLNPATLSMQVASVFGLISAGFVHLLARKLATPVFNLHGIRQKDRTHVHALWMSFWLVGLVVGLLPTLLPLN